MALLQDKVAIITGASKGIGRALSLCFARENASIICAARSISRSTSSGSCRCGWWVANAQYLQWHRHVRERESVTLRENVTRRRMQG